MYDERAFSLQTPQVAGYLLYKRNVWKKDKWWKALEVKVCSCAPVRKREKVQNVYTKNMYKKNKKKKHHGVIALTSRYLNCSAGINPFIQTVIKTNFPFKTQARLLTLCASLWIHKHLSQCNFDRIRQLFGLCVLSTVLVSMCACVGGWGDCG